MIPTAVLLLVLLGAIVGGATVIGAPIFAIPIVAVVVAAWGAVTIGRRALTRERRREPVRFTDEDRATMVPSPTPAERAANRRRSAEDARS